MEAARPLPSELKLVPPPHFSLSPHPTTAVQGTHGTVNRARGLRSLRTTCSATCSRDPAGCASVSKRRGEAVPRRGAASSRPQAPRARMRRTHGASNSCGPSPSCPCWLVSGADAFCSPAATAGAAPAAAAASLAAGTCRRRAHAHTPCRLPALAPWLQVGPPQLAHRCTMQRWGAACCKAMLRHRRQPRQQVRLQPQQTAAQSSSTKW